MDAHPFAMPAWGDVAPTGMVMSSAEYAVLVRELQNLRDAHRTELAQRLHDVRAYRLIGRRTSDSPPHEVSLSSPVGKALRGARTGDVVHVGLPNGRERTLTVLGVTAVAQRLDEVA